MISEVTMSSGVELRRHSVGIASSENHEIELVPRYLRASIGSCHDFCKYGRKLLVKEEKEKLSITKRAEKAPLHRSSEESIGGRRVSAAKLKASLDFEPKKISAVKQTKSVDSESHISDTSETHKQELATKSSGSQKQIGNEVYVNKNKASLHPKSHISSIPKTRRQGISPSFEVEIPSKPISKSVVETSPKSISPLRSSCERMNRASHNEMELSEKHVTSLSPDSVTKQTVSSMMKKRESSCKVASLSRASLSSKSSCKKNVSLSKNQPKANKAEPEEHNNEPEEKTLYVIKMETANQTLQSDQNESQDSELSLSNSPPSPKFSSSLSFKSSSQGQEKSEYATSQFEEDSSSGNSDIEHMENVETLEVEENGKSSPRELKLQRDEVLGDNAIDVKADAENVGAITGPEKVVLRHQDVQVKKDEQVLYNNVIKETASKLIETQKGKVKALVSAFETIISLQEKRISANIIN
ncbi:hypothetical protein VNO77_21308 [Canavalia gladiata]|uniref:Calmodulin-binding domain-containing protein n=1 Tax=Canavalia gladiata TaxID=3824 RepID=A0AAN9LRR3_CANGL